VILGPTDRVKDCLLQYFPSLTPIYFCHYRRDSLLFCSSAVVSLFPGGREAQAASLVQFHSKKTLPGIHPPLYNNVTIAPCLNLTHTHTSVRLKTSTASCASLSPNKLTKKAAAGTIGLSYEQPDFTPAQLLCKPPG